jgi:DNA-binding protein HU-beta
VVSHELSAGNQVALIGFGTFKVVDRAERLGRNVRTGEVITIPAKRVARFSVGKLLKDSVAAEAKTKKPTNASKTPTKKK